MKPMEMAKCKGRLAVLWFAACGFIFAVVILQTLIDSYRGRADEVWKWLLPSVMPTLSLIIGVFALENSQAKDNRRASKLFFRLSLALSSFYLVVVASFILLQPIMTVSPVELMKQSQVWMAPFQGLVSASIGGFFVRRQPA